MGRWSQAWNNFLSTLATRGGAIFILLVLSLTGFGITLHIIHHGESDSMAAAGLITTVGNFTGALLLALKGSSETTSTAIVSPEGKVMAKVTEGQGSTTAETPKP
jgi:hypothetical protein